MRKIDIDDDVYAALAARAVGFDTPNEVLRRVLLDEVSAAPAVVPPATVPGPARSVTSTLRGSMAVLIERGLLAPGDVLIHRQVRKGREFQAYVEADGQIRTERGRYREPSPALGDLTGTSVNGWKEWIHEKSGKTLKQLDTEALRQTPTDGGNTALDRCSAGDRIVLATRTSTGEWLETHQVLANDGGSLLLVRETGGNGSPVEWRLAVGADGTGLHRGNSWKMIKQLGPDDPGVLQQPR